MAGERSSLQVVATGMEGLKLVSQVLLLLLSLDRPAGAPSRTGGASLCGVWWPSVARAARGKRDLYILGSASTGPSRSQPDGHDPDRGGPGPVLSLRRNLMPGTKELM